MELVSKLLISTMLLYILIEAVWWAAMQPPPTLQAAMSHGFPSPGCSLEYMANLSNGLRRELAGRRNGSHFGYVLYAFVGTYVRRQFYYHRGGVFYMNLLAGSVFGPTQGLLLATLSSTLGALLAVCTAQYSSIVIFWFAGGDLRQLSRRIPGSPVRSLLARLIREAQAGGRSHVMAPTTTRSGQSQGRHFFSDENSQVASFFRVSVAQLADYAYSFYGEVKRLMRRLIEAAGLYSRLYGALQAVTRLLPILPGVVVNYTCVQFPISWTRLPVVIALGSLPYNLYTVGYLGTRWDPRLNPNGPLPTDTLFCAVMSFTVLTLLSGTLTLALVNEEFFAVLVRFLDIPH